MQLNQATDYAFRVVLYLSMQPAGSIINGQSIAEKQKIPPQFLQKVMRSLSKAGLIKSYRGVDGGFELTLQPNSITLYDVITAMEGPIDIHRCLGDRGFCTRSVASHCTVHAALAEVQSRFIADLQSISFAKLMEEHTKIAMEKGEEAG